MTGLISINLCCRCTLHSLSVFIGACTRPWLVFACLIMSVHLQPAFSWSCNSQTARLQALATKCLSSDAPPPPPLAENPHGSYPLAILEYVWSSGVQHVCNCIYDTHSHSHISPWGRVCMLIANTWDDAAEKAGLSTSCRAAMYLNRHELQNLITTITIETCKYSSCLPSSG